MSRLILALLLALTASPVWADITTGLVDHHTYNVDGTATVGNAATLTNGASVTGSSMIGAGAMALDGTNHYANHSTYASSDGASAWTIACWVYPVGVSSSEDFSQIVAKYVSNTSRAGIEQGGSGAGGADDVIVNVSTGASRFGYTTDNVLAANTWAHVVLAFDGSLTGDANRLKCYVNGTQRTLTITAGVPATMLNSASDAWWVGWRDDSPAGFAFGSRVDDFRMYSRALSDSDVTELYNYRESSGTTVPNPIIIESAVERGRQQFYAALKLNLPSWGLAP